MGPGRNVFKSFHMGSFTTLAVRKGLNVLNKKHVIKPICPPCKDSGQRTRQLLNFFIVIWFIQLNFNIDF